MVNKEEMVSVKDLVVNGVYQTWVHDIVKVLEINEVTKTVKFYNVSGSHNQWTLFKHINIIKRFY